MAEHVFEHGPALSLIARERTRSQCGVDLNCGVRRQLACPLGGFARHELTKIQPPGRELAFRARGQEEVFDGRFGFARGLFHRDGVLRDL